MGCSANDGTAGTTKKPLATCAACYRPSVAFLIFELSLNIISFPPQKVATSQNTRTTWIANRLREDFPWNFAAQPAGTVRADQLQAFLFGLHNIRLQLVTASPVYGLRSAGKK